MIEIFMAFIEYYFQIVCGIEEDKLKYQIVSPYCPNIVLASVLIFMGFSFLRLKESRLIMRISEASFIIYLCHAGIWDMIIKLFYVIKEKSYLVNMNCLYIIPIFVVIVFVGAFLAAKLYNTVISAYLCKIKANLFP